MIDCADPACQPDHECVPEVPRDWQGYYRLDVTAFPSAMVVGCPDGDVSTPYYDTPGGAADCAACSCGDADGGDCGLPQMGYFVNNGACGGGSASYAPSDTDCHSFTNNHTCNGGCSNGQGARVTDGAELISAPTCSAVQGGGHVGRDVGGTVERVSDDGKWCRLR